MSAVSKDENLKRSRSPHYKAIFRMVARDPITTICQRAQKTGSILSSVGRNLPALFLCIEKTS